MHFFAKLTRSANVVEQNACLFVEPKVFSFSVYRFLMIYETLSTYYCCTYTVNYYFLYSFADYRYSTVGKTR